MKYFVTLCTYIYFSDRFFDSSLPSINPNQRQTGQNSKKHIREDAEVNEIITKKRNFY